MLLFLTAVVAGLALLVWSADRFVYGASGLASLLGIPPLIIGLTVVGIGTSAPEMLVSAMAALDGVPGLAIGNAVGSNIANIALVVGATALVLPMTVGSETLKREFPTMFVVMLLVLGLLLDGNLGRLDGVLLLVITVVLMAWVVRIGVGARGEDPLGREYESEIPSEVTLPRAALALLVGLALLILASRLVVWGASGIAAALGVSDLVIGLTVVAVGTSLPELAAAITSALKGEPDIAIGNIIGSNMFNLLPVLAMPGLIHPDAFEPEVLTRDYPIMLALTVALFLMAYGFRGQRRRINRIEGGLLLATFAGYQYLLYRSVAG
jgi:cation:H+ antiporter